MFFTKLSEQKEKRPVFVLYDNFVKSEGLSTSIFAQKRRGNMIEPTKQQKPLLTLDDVQPLNKDSRIDTAKERRSRSLNGEKYDVELLTECARSWMNKEGFREERARVLKMLFGNQWGELIHVHGLGVMSEEEWIKRQGLTPLNNNVMYSLWMSVFGIHAKQETEPVCYARHQNAKALSDNLSAAIQSNWQNQYMGEKLDFAFAESLISSGAFVRNTYEEREEIPDSYNDIENPYFMFWESGNDPTHQDIYLIGCIREMTKEELYYQFAKPEYGLTIEDLRDIFSITDEAHFSSQQLNERYDKDNINFYHPSDPSLVHVIEVWRIDVRPRYQLKDLLATTPSEKYSRCEKEDLPFVLAINRERKAMYEAQGVPVDKRVYITAKEIVDKTWNYEFLAPNGRVLCSGESPYDHKSHPWTVSLFPYINGEAHPFMGGFIDQQKYINRMVMINDFAIRSAAKGMTFLPLSMKPEDMTVEQYANQKTRFDAVFVYDDTKTRSDRKPEFYTHSAFNTGANEMLQIQLNMIHEVSGVHDALQGKTPQSGTAAARYAMEAQNATTTIYPLIKKFNGFEERVAKKTLITLQQYYEEGRDITPKKSDKQIFYKANACRDIKANISIKNSAASAAFYQMGNELLNTLFTNGAIDVRTYLKNLDAPYADKILQDIDTYMNQMQTGQTPAGPVQVPGADQQQADMATQLLNGPGQLFTRHQPGAQLTPAK